MTVQRFTASGAANGKPVVATTLYLANGQQSLAMDATGRFVVAWDDFVNGKSSVFAQRFTAAGAKVGAAITVAAAPNPGVNWMGDVSMNASGRFVVTWSDRGAGNRAQVYDWGTPVGGPVTVAGEGVSTIGEQVIGSDVDDAGNVLFTWNAGVQNVYETSEVRARRLTAGGVLEPQTIVNTTTQGLQYDANVVFTGTDRFVVAWRGYGPGDDHGIFAQRFGPVTAPLAATAQATSATLVPAVMIDDNDDVW